MEIVSPVHALLIGVASPNPILARTSSSPVGLEKGEALGLLKSSMRCSMTEAGAPVRRPGRLSPVSSSDGP